MGTFRCLVFLLGVGCLGGVGDSAVETADSASCEEVPDEDGTHPETCCDGLDGDGDGQVDESAPSAEQCYQFDPIDSHQCFPGPWVCGDADAPGVCMPPLLSADACDELMSG